MNVAIGILAGMFITSSFIGLVYAVVESLRGRLSDGFDLSNPFDVVMLLALVSFLAMMVCIGIAGNAT